MEKYILTFYRLIFCFIILFHIPVMKLFSQDNSIVTDGYQAAYKYLGNSANNDDHYGLFNGLQGIANGHPAAGDSYWYFSRERVGKNQNTWIFRVKYDQHLGHNFDYVQKKVWMPGKVEYCKHVGDIDYFVCKRKGYIAAGYDKGCNNRSYIAIFRADDFNSSENSIHPWSVIDVTHVQGPRAPWVAVRVIDPFVYIYSSWGSQDKPSEIYEYKVEQGYIEIGQYSSVPSFEYRTIQLKDENGNPAGSSVNYKQGADFSTDGNLFYVVVGMSNEIKSGYPYRRIHVFKVTGDTWHRVKKSNKNTVPFTYKVTGGLWQEPEGLSYFDMNDIHPYHPKMPRGELHVILYDHEWGDDDVYIKHYTSIIRVRPSIGIINTLFYEWLYGHGPSEGLYDPYYEWWDGHGAWDGAILLLKPGYYNEKVVLQGKAVKIVSENGLVRIGAPSSEIP